jgi:hypothetical protein
MSDHKNINIQKNYSLFQLSHGISALLSSMLGYIQSNTPYGEEYKAAYDSYQKLREAYGDFEEKCADCVDLIFEIEHKADSEGE